MTHSRVRLGGCPVVRNFAAETISIVAVQVVVGIMAQKTTHRLSDAFIIAALYPLSLVLVIGTSSVDVGSAVHGRCRSVCLCGGCASWTERPVCVVVGAVTVLEQAGLN